MEKELTPEQVRSILEGNTVNQTDIETKPLKTNLPPLPEYQPPPKKLNNFKIPDNPKNPPYNGKLISKRTFWILISIILILTIILLINMFWLNISISGEKLKGNVTVNNNIQVDTPDVPVTIDDKDTNNYNFTIQNEVKVSDSEIDKIINEVVEGIKDEINVTT